MQEYRDPVRLASEFYSPVACALQMFWNRSLKQASFEQNKQNQKLLNNLSFDCTDFLERIKTNNKTF